ncbi:hypothetical protein [Asanoa siamensis]|uniref:Uncharacterized protein n=1 Tax=Asanoa siamensis TaxID=926357 RepID=A0ABQ4D2F9_9ACTN|nr:hypothetical protein [Asanoa siamensis]GIF77731.1 hypothetical protein Asi02nite_72490 [Asanoa siamensis]
MPTAFALVIPHSWSEYDLNGAHLAQAWAQARREATTDGERVAVDDAYGQADELLRAFAGRGALAAAGLVEPHDEGLLMAFVAVFALTDVDDLRGMSTVDLAGVGYGFRISGTRTVPVAGAQVPLYSMSTAIPVPGRPSEMLLVTAVSPNVTEATELAGLFATITGTLRFLEPSTGR